jgi:hypothetical protein
LKTLMFGGARTLLGLCTCCEQPPGLGKRLQFDHLAAAEPDSL